jgi:hypothetical protein
MVVPVENTSKIIRQYTDDVKNTSMVINGYLCKGDSKYTVGIMDEPRSYQD